MTQVNLIMPKMGESVHEATIIKWLKNEGDKVALDEPILEIATDKVDSEIPSPSEGILSKKFFKEGDVVQVGKVIAIISSMNHPEEHISVPNTQTQVKVQENGEKTIAEKNIETVPQQSPKESQMPYSSLSEREGKRFYSPLVRNIAKQEGISLAELETIKGTGKGGRVTKHDILAYIPNRNKQAEKKLVEQVIPSLSEHSGEKDLSRGTTPSIYVSEFDEVIEMDRMRKLIAEHMVMSKRVSPHVTSFVEADVTNIVKWRDRIKSSFEQKEGEKITFTPIFIEAIVKAIKDFPMINVSVDGTKIIKRKNINIGMATALPSGNLIVPVIKNADRYNLLGLTKVVNDLANRARANKLLPDEIQGGTFTLTNVGVFGNLMGTPIINQPQVAILATGVIKKKPVVIETEQGDMIGIRSMMFLSLSYDHRVIDGMLGGSFLRRVADYLEKFDIDRNL